MPGDGAFADLVYSCSSAWRSKSICGTFMAALCGTLFTLTLTRSVLPFASAAVDDDGDDEDLPQRVPHGKCRKTLSVATALFCSSLLGRSKECGSSDVGEGVSPDFGAGNGRWSNYDHYSSSNR
ncbi:uncharacterized protein LOC123327254 [Drosophila simulans]|uniref:uncharacterized protein LOC123327254 n=1 Tax=Drosophila simulans TaxID=7240 RepID=UPI001D11AC01|nr:uncharacterized protein LOC123327254 [Drosophila simulans]